MIDFLLVVNKQGQTRLSYYYQFLKQEERINLEGEAVRRCLSRSQDLVKQVPKNSAPLQNLGGIR